MDAAAQLDELAQALREEKQNRNWLKELEDKLVTLQSQKKVALRKLAENQAVLDRDPALTAVARKLMKTALEQAGAGDAEFSVYNPKFVTKHDKQRLLVKILRDFKKENPKADGMSFTAIRNVLLNRYNIETPSAGLFFRNEVKLFDTVGGNRNKQIVIDVPKLMTREAQLRNRDEEIHSPNLAENSRKSS